MYGKITVTLKSSTEADGFVTRKFEVIEEGKVSANDALLYIYGFNLHSLCSDVLCHSVPLLVGPPVASGCPSSEGDPAALQGLDGDHLP